jgi:type IV secretory pathway VirB10-like protein
MAPEPAVDTVRYNQQNSSYSNEPRMIANDSLYMTLANNDVIPNQQPTAPAATYKNVDHKDIITTNQNLANDLNASKQQNQQQPIPITANSIGRDATKTDILADIEFAEAMLSRRASSIAKEKGLALIPAMRTIELRLLTSVDTEQGGKFKALVTTDVWDAGFANVGIPAGTFARGVIESSANDGDTRIKMTITEFILPSGDLIQLRIADAVTDSHGASGPRGNVNHKWLTRLGSTAVCGILGAISSLGSNSKNNINSNNNAPLSLEAAIRQNLAGEFGSQGMRSLERGIQIQPTIELREGATIAMILGSNIYLIPWERLRTTIPAPNNRLVR